MSLAHFTIRVSGQRHVAWCRCGHHQPVGAWTRTDLETKIRSL